MYKTFIFKQRAKIQWHERSLQLSISCCDDLLQLAELDIATELSSQLGAGHVASSKFILRYASTE